MRRLLIALPFLVLGLFYLFMELRMGYLMVVLLGWLTFALEYRYGGESKEGEELVAFSVSASIVIAPLHVAFAEVFAVFIFLMEVASLFAKFKLFSRS
ncbi:hypothetical protein [Thermococcus sp. MAR1]|uniref:hypothetical protein n=1 Tax=Thermococcus sp. MAR1 TaxID=1638263 RepID=UPI001439EC54|nr:hypothetical protein [Thermococcus sp. MAR1]NJE10047.1 hypothetical protein [Thermococcus sp. MAR1]